MSKKCSKCNNVKWKNKATCKECTYIYDVAMRYESSYEEISMLYTHKNCMICESKFKDSRDRHIDHCHDSGNIRGILCRSCNVMLGYAKDNPQKLLNGIKYLESHYSHWDSVLDYEKIII